MSALPQPAKTVLSTIVLRIGNQLPFVLADNVREQCDRVRANFQGTLGCSENVY